jgi:CBS domain-containing protein
MRALDRIRRTGIAVGPERTLRGVAQLMERAGVGFIAIVDGDELIGVVTDRDIVRRGVAQGLPADARVDAVMTTPVRTIDATTELDDALYLFGEANVRRLAVVDDGRFIGVVSLDDLLVDAVTKLNALVAPLAQEIAWPHREHPHPVPA